VRASRAGKRPAAAGQAPLPTQRQPASSPRPRPAASCFVRSQLDPCGPTHRLAPAVPAGFLPWAQTLLEVEGLGHDPLRAVGANLLELPGLSRRVLPRRSNVFRLAYRRRLAEDARTRFEQVAERRGRVTDELWQEVRVSDDEFARARLMPKDI
jgi:hypothetical protein